jgi:hypothetical protein
MRLYWEVPAAIGWRVLRTSLKHFEDRIHQIHKISVEPHGDDEASYRPMFEF